MSVTVDLPAEALRRLEAEAARRGVSIDAVITELADTLPAESKTGRRRLAIVGVGASGEGISHRIDEILADGFGRD
ncbi:MAG: hypothetical protein HYX32_07135 [Actinobacteria bacterium]|nr:hypothetical protein [Actinomycetota bacterium]